MRYDIPCVHESGVPVSETCSDYHSLTKPEIADLLYTAKVAIHEHDDAQIASSIQCRLIQGIVGVVCPHEIEGAVVQKMVKLNKLFVDYVEGELPEYSDQEIVDKLYALMQE